MIPSTQSQIADLYEKFEKLSTEVAELKGELKEKNELIKVLTKLANRVDNSATKKDAPEKSEEDSSDSPTEEKLCALTLEGVKARLPTVDRIHSMLRVPAKFSGIAEFLDFYMKLKNIFKSLGYEKSFEIFENKGIKGIKQIKTSDAFILSNYLTTYFYKTINVEVGEVLYEEDSELDEEGDYNNGFVLLNKLWEKFLGKREESIDVYPLIEKIKIGENYDKPEAVRATLKHIRLIAETHAKTKPYDDERVAQKLAEAASKTFKDGVLKMLENANTPHTKGFIYRYETVESLLADLEQINLKKVIVKSETLDPVSAPNKRLLNYESKKDHKSSDTRMQNHGGSKTSTVGSNNSKAKPTKTKFNQATKTLTNKSITLHHIKEKDLVLADATDVTARPW